MDPITKWFLIGFCVLVALAGCLWIWQEHGWMKRMDKLVHGDKKK